MRMVVENFETVNSCNFIILQQLLTESYIEKNTFQKFLCNLDKPNGLLLSCYNMLQQP